MSHEQTHRAGHAAHNHHDRRASLTIDRTMFVMAIIAEEQAAAAATHNDEADADYLAYWQDVASHTFVTFIDNEAANHG